MQYKNRLDLARFLKTASIFILTLILIDLLAGALLKTLYFKQKYESLTYDINYADQDVLVFGSSRALHHYVPSIFENKLHMSFYNCGRDGALMVGAWPDRRALDLHGRGGVVQTSLSRKLRRRG